MSIIQSHNLESHASTLQRYFQALQKSHDLITFYETVNNAQLVLEELSSIVRTQEAKFSRCIPTSLFLQIFTFFPSSYLYSCRGVCKIWLGLLCCSESEQISRNLQRSRPRCISSWSCDYVSRISSYKDQLYVCNLLAQIKVYSNDGIFIKDFLPVSVPDGGIVHEPNGLVVSDNYIAISWPYCVGLFNPAGKLYQVWKRLCPGENIIIHEKLVYASMGSEIMVYSLENELRKTWSLHNQPGRLEMSEGELFVLCGGNCIEVYSKEGKKKRSWELDSESTQSMSVGKNIICVSDGSWIQVYTRDGIPLFQWLETDCRDVLVVGDDLLYVAFKDKIKAFHLD